VVIRGDADSPSSEERPGRLRGADAVRLHLTLAAGLTICVGAFCFEVLRALGGNKLSWLYVFEWPMFAAFAVYMWWMLLTGQDRHRPSPPNDRPAAPEQLHDEPGEEHDEQLEAWQRYLREMDGADAKERDRAT